MCVSFHRAAISLTLEIQAQSGPTLREFKFKLAQDPEIQKKIAQYRAEVEEFALQFPMPGHEGGYA